MKHKKLLILITLLFTMLLLRCNGFAYNHQQCGETASYTIENGVLTISGTGKMYDYLSVYGNGNYSVNGYGITGHGKTAEGEYYYRMIPWSTGETNEGERIRKIVVQEGITYIGINAFHDMFYVEEVSLPSTLEGIGSGCFYGCSSLKSLDIPASVRFLGEKGTVNNFAMFEYCSELKTLNIPEDSLLTYIEAGALFASGVEKIYIPDYVEEIGFSALASKNMRRITVSEDNMYYKSVDGVLFNKDMSTLITYPMEKDDPSYTVPDTVTKIEARAFYGIGKAFVIDWERGIISKTFKLYIPDTVTQIGEEAFDTEISIKIYFGGNEDTWKSFEVNNKFLVKAEETSYNIPPFLFKIISNSSVLLVCLGIIAFITQIPIP